MRRHGRQEGSAKVHEFVSHEEWVGQHLVIRHVFVQCGNVLQEHNGKMPTESHEAVERLAFIFREILRPFCHAIFQPQQEREHLLGELLGRLD